MTVTEFDRQADVLVASGHVDLTARKLKTVLGPLRERAASVAEPFVLVPVGLVPPAAALAAVTREGKPGFVSADLADLDRFADTTEAEVPDAPAYLLLGVERGDEYLNWSPEEALPAIRARGRSPLTVAEGVALLTQRPDLLEPNRCFMLLGSRCGDKRVPALWISGGTGKDGRERRGAAKLGWCWAGNRHTWLGHASAAGRVA